MAYETGGKLFLLNFAIGLGTFIQVLDSSIANVAIPYIAGALAVSTDDGTWVITSFAASNAVVLPLTGWLSDYFGRVKLFVWSVLLFSIISFLCGLSTSLTMLIILRVFQGAVAGSLIPLSQSLMYLSNPPDKQGAALGFWGMIVIVAPILGPIIGGYLTEVYSWPWIFYVNVPIGLFSAFVTWHFLRDKDSKIVRNPIDWIGLFLLSLGVACLQIMLDKGEDLDWWNSNVIISLLVISVISLSYFIVWTLGRKNPIVDFSAFRSRNFLVGTICTTLGYLVYFGSAVTLPLWLQTQQGYMPYWAGVAIAPIGLVPFIFSTTLGKNLYRLDLRLWTVGSFILLSIGFFYQANFTTEVSLEHIMFNRFLQGFGVALFFLPLVQLSMAEIPKDKYPSATGLFHFIRILVGSGFGTSLSIYLWWRLATFHHARLAEAMTTYRSQVVELFQQFGIYFKHEVIEVLIERLVQQQAYMLSTNDISWLGAWLFLAMIPLIFFCKKTKMPAGDTGSSAAH